MKRVRFSQQAHDNIHHAIVKREKLFQLRLQATVANAVNSVAVVCANVCAGDTHERTTHTLVDVAAADAAAVVVVVYNNVVSLCAWMRRGLSLNRVYWGDSYNYEKCV